MAEVVIGVFEKFDETKNTYKYAREAENGRREVQYVQKSVFEGQEVPEKIEVVARPTA